MVNRRILALVLFSGTLLGLILTGEAQQESLDQRQTLRRHLLEASATSNGNGQVASASNNAGGNGDGNGPPPNNGEGNIKNGEPGRPMRAVHFTIDADSEFKKNTKDVAPSGQACFGGCSRCKSEPSCPIDYNNYNSATNTGPPVMNGAVTIYYIFYGFWNDPSTALKEQILVNLATGIGRSAYLSINNNYFSVTSGVKKPLTVGSGNNNPTYGKQYYDLYQSFPKGTTLSQTNLATIVTNALSSGGLPTDTNAVYFVLTSSDVAVGDSNGHFCSNYCGYHSTLSYTNLPIKWATVGDASVQCPGGCISSVVQSNPPNGDAGADGMASVISHELEETLTDPQLNAWYDAKGEENADKCAWTFGTVKGNYNVDLSAIVPAPSGTRYTGRYLIQQNFNPNTKACVLS